MYGETNRKGYMLRVGVRYWRLWKVLATRLKGLNVPAGNLSRVLPRLRGKGQCQDQRMFVHLRQTLLIYDFTSNLISFKFSERSMFSDCPEKGW